MKNIKQFFLTLVLFIATTMAAMAQQTVAIDEIAVISPKNTKNAVLLGETSHKFISVFGKPNSISDFYAEIDEETLKVYHYGTNKFYFSKDSLSSFEINTSDFLVGQPNKQYFTIGEKIKSLENKLQFHQFKIEKSNGKSRNLAYSYIAYAQIKAGETPTDTGIELLFDDNEKLFNIAFLQ